MCGLVFLTTLSCFPWYMYLYLILTFSSFLSDSVKFRVWKSIVRKTMRIMLVLLWLLQTLNLLQRHTAQIIPYVGKFWQHHTVRDQQREVWLRGPWMNLVPVLVLTGPVPFQGRGKWLYNWFQVFFIFSLFIDLLFSSY